jgi:hypothetical protein
MKIKTQFKITILIFLGLFVIGAYAASCVCGYTGTKCTGVITRASYSLAGSWACYIGDPGSSSNECDYCAACKADTACYPGWADGWESWHTCLRDDYSLWTGGICRNIPNGMVHYPLGCPGGLDGQDCSIFDDCCRGILCLTDKCVEKSGKWDQSEDMCVVCSGALQQNVIADTTQKCMHVENYELCTNEEWTFLDCAYEDVNTCESGCGADSVCDEFGPGCKFPLDCSAGYSTRVDCCDDYCNFYDDTCDVTCGSIIECDGKLPRDPCYRISDGKLGRCSDDCLFCLLETMPCNGLCELGFEDQDPDCVCIDNNGCCGLGCDHNTDNDCNITECIEDDPFLNLVSLDGKSSYDPGNTSDRGINVINLDSSACEASDFRVSVTCPSLPSGWVCDVPVTDITVDANDYIPIALYVTSPDTVIGGEEYTYTIEVENLDRSTNNYDTLQGRYLVKACDTDGLCDRYCPPGCTDDYDPDCGCKDGNGCCGEGCARARASKMEQLLE